MLGTTQCRFHMPAGLLPTDYGHDVDHHRFQKQGVFLIVGFFEHRVEFRVVEVGRQFESVAPVVGVGGGDQRGNGMRYIGRQKLGFPLSLVFLQSPVPQ